MDELLPGLLIVEKRPCQRGDEDEIEEMGHSEPALPSFLRYFMSGSPDNRGLKILAFHDFLSSLQRVETSTHDQSKEYAMALF
jgi:hypothetical protein